jgi:YHS domain-containing protein
MDPNSSAGADDGSSAVAVDPVCGMRVERALAAGTEDFHGQTYFFCSASCKQTFRANPGHYAAAPPDREPDDPRRRR